MTAIHVAPDTMTRLTRMGDVTFFEPAGDAPHDERHARPRRAPDAFQSRGLEDCISQVSTPAGARPILKTMLTTACERNCFYCPFRAGRSRTQRITISPDEMAKATDALARASKITGIFLSSGIIKGSVTTQDKIIDTAEILRRRYRYRGYIHLKVMPGAEEDQLYRSMQLADRISVNLEGPTPERLGALAPKKDFNRELLSLLHMADKIRREHPHERLARPVTQFVVGAVGDTDAELLTLTSQLYNRLSLARAYYSAFEPVLQTPLENVGATAPVREFRLYQSSFLLRDYAWDVEDLPFTDGGNLRHDVDPKTAWAEVHLKHAPVDLVTAERHDLLRVPGIGPKSADLILKARGHSRLSDLNDLRKLGIAAPEKAAPFILLGGRAVPVQQSLF
jgi:predicted DNA-binding helix-hairpin-helix protein